MSLDPRIARLFVVATVIVVGSQFLIRQSESGPSLDERFEKAATLRSYGQLDDALFAYRAAADRFPLAARAWVEYGQFLNELNDPAQADDAFAHACGAPAVSSNAAAIASAWRHRGERAWSVRNADETQADLTRAAAGGDIDGRRLLGLFLGCVRHDERADQVMREVLAAAPGDPLATAWLADERARAGDAAAATTMHDAISASASSASAQWAPWLAYLDARWLAIRSDPSAASALISVLSARVRPPLTRADVLRDPAFAPLVSTDAAPALAKAIADLGPP